MNSLDVKHLTIALRQDAGRDAEKLLVQDIRFSIGERQTLAVAGESGSGKTLTALAVMGLLDRSVFSVKGSCLFFTQQRTGAGNTPIYTNDTFENDSVPSATGKPVDLFSLTEKERKTLCLEEIAMIYQNPFRSLSPVEKIKTHIKHICTIKQRQPDSGWLHTLFDAVQLDRKEILNKYPHELSGGELQRVMMILSLLFKPQLLICDEPTASLDYQTGLHIISLLNTLKQSTGMSLLFISHDISLVRDIADAVIIMKNGRIVETGEAELIFTRPKQAYTHELIQASYLEKRC